LELAFLDELDFEINENCEIILPPYVSKLQQDEISLIRSSNDPSKKVIAAGTDPKDQKITLITATGKVMIFDAKKFCVPDGPAVPTSTGEKVFLPNADNRWPSPVEGFYVDSEWMLKNSTSGLVGATLSVNNYNREDNNR
jgi:hypothetical protein